MAKALTTNGIMDFLNLPDSSSPARSVTVTPVTTGEPIVLMDYAGSGCIKRFQATIGTEPSVADLRQTIIRMYWDGQTEPAVQAPLGDFLGMVNGTRLYPMNSRYINLQFHSISTLFFPMPFAESARIEIVAGPGVSKNTNIFWQVDFDRYSPGSLKEDLRFHAQFRREFPCKAFDRNYTVLDAIGRGRLVGYTLGVRVYDDRTRWSHAGGEHIYIVNRHDSPAGPFAHLRSLGGETPFSAGHGGALHQASSHLDQGIAYYEHEDMGTARAWQRIIGYRFFHNESIAFDQRLQFRFGAAANDICSTAYWYQDSPHRPFFRLPIWDKLMPGSELRRGAHDLLEEVPSWQVCGPFHPEGGRMMDKELPVEAEEFDPNASYEQTSYPELTEGRGTGPQEHIIAISDPHLADTDGSVWRRGNRHIACWRSVDDIDGFVDFGNVFRPIGLENTVQWPAIGFAQTCLHVEAPTNITIQLGWVSELRLQVNDGPWQTFEFNIIFDCVTLQAQLQAGPNRVRVKVHNPDDARELGRSFGTWLFAFRALLPNGQEIHPQLPPL